MGELDMNKDKMLTRDELYGLREDFFRGGRFYAFDFDSQGIHDSLEPPPEFWTRGAPPDCHGSTSPRPTDEYRAHSRPPGPSNRCHREVRLEDQLMGAVLGILRGSCSP